MDEQLKVYCGVCPDQACLAQLYFWTIQEQVECDKCLQTHNVEALLNQYETDKKIKPNNPKPRGTPDFIKVNGLSNFQCKLLSPLLTVYGMDKSGNSKLLKDLGHAEIIDCGKVLGSRSFMISPDHIDIMGYGKDRSGSLIYLSDFLDLLKDFHNGEERLVAIHADGDGHCLVHALSRAMTGRELFWHGLRRNLQDHLNKRLAEYMELFKDFHNKEEWTGIIAEADPNCTSSGKMTDGLGNIHIFALSNILKRPIILFDSPQKMQSSGDYTGLFVPALVDPAECRNQSPLCIAWSGAAHNHFVALVAVEGRKIPHIPASLIPHLWGITSDVAERYLTYNEDGSLTVCDGKPIRSSYLRKLSAAMETEFIRHHFVAPFLVEDLHRYVYNYNELLVVCQEELTTLTAKAVMEKRLFRCLNCKALQEALVLESDVQPGGELYEVAVKLYGKLKSCRFYGFPTRKVVCEYNSEKDMLVVIGLQCTYCHSEEAARHVDVTGKVCYIHGDRTDTDSASGGKKYYWNGNEYDNKPMKFNLTLHWKEKGIKAPVTWFHGDSNPALNSDPVIEAKRIAEEYFPEENNMESFVRELSVIINDKSIELIRTGKKFVEASFSETVYENAPTTSSYLRDGTPGYMHVDGEDSNRSTSISSDQKLLNAVEPSPGNLQSALKRKSSGEVASASTGQNHEENEVKVQPHIVVKICLPGGLTQTFKLDPEIDYNGLQNAIYAAFQVHPEQQILKHDFPPKLLVPPADGGPLALKSGDKIQVVIKQPDPVQEMPDQAWNNKLNLSKRETFSLPAFDKHAETEALLRSFNLSGHSSLVEYAFERPELFYPGGYFYEEFKQDLGLKSGQHCHLPLLPGFRFYYNQIHNRIGLCLEPEGHFPIDEEVKLVIRKFQKPAALESANHDTKFQPGNSQRLVTSDSLIRSSPKPRPKSLNLAPGYRTLNEAPTEISTEQNTIQNEDLKKMVEELKAKRSEGTTKRFTEKIPSQNDKLERAVDKIMAKPSEGPTKSFTESIPSRTEKLEKGMEETKDEQSDSASKQLMSSGHER